MERPCQPVVVTPLSPCQKSRFWYVVGSEKRICLRTFKPSMETQIYWTFSPDSPQFLHVPAILEGLDYLRLEPLAADLKLKGTAKRIAKSKVTVFKFLNWKIVVQYSTSSIRMSSKCIKYRFQTKDLRNSRLVPRLDLLRFQEVL